MNTRLFSRNLYCISNVYINQNISALNVFLEDTSAVLFHSSLRLRCKGSKKALALYVLFACFKIAALHLNLAMPTTGGRYRVFLEVPFWNSAE